MSSDFQLSKQVDPNKIFLIKVSELDRRLDPEYYKPFYKKLLMRINAQKTICLKHVAAVFSGSTPAKSDYADNKTLYPIIKVSSYSDEFIDLSRVAYSTKATTLKAVKGDIYILSSAHQADYVGRFMKFLGTDTEQNTSFVGELLCVRSRENQAKYLFAILNTKIYKNLINREKRGQTSHIYPNDIGKIKIPIPPKEVQAQIVAKMDTAYITKKQKEAEARRLLDSIDDYLFGELGIELPEQEKNTIASRMFTRRLSEISGGRFDPFYYQNYYMLIDNFLNHLNNVKHLGELLQMITSGARPKGGVRNIESGILSFGGEHINNQYEVKTNTSKYIPIEFHNSHKMTETKLNDLLLVKDGATTGKIGIINTKNHVGQNINEHLFLLRSNNDVNPAYLLYCLHSSIGNLQLKREITGGTVTGLTSDVVRQVKVVIPPLEKQNEIAEHINQIRQQAKQHQNDAEIGLEQAKKDVETMILG